MRKPDRTSYAITPEDEKRFWSNIDKLGEHWWWVGMYEGRYPRMRLESGEYAASGTLALQVAGVPLPEGRRVRYLCMQKQCVNPDHLGTYSKKAGPWTSTKHHDRWGNRLVFDQ